MQKFRRASLTLFAEYQICLICSLAQLKSEVGPISERTTRLFCEIATQFIKHKMTNNPVFEFLDATLSTFSKQVWWLCRNHNLETILKNN